MTGWEADDQSDEYPEWAYDPVDYCQRCNGVLAMDTGGLVTLDCGPGDVVEWALCDECVDSFTAWRLAGDAPIAAAGADQLPA